MGRRSRRRAAAGRSEGAGRLSAPTSDYRDGEGNTLTLRGSLSAASRREYARALAGEGRPSATREDAWARAGELLFERLAVRWSIAGVPLEGQRELRARYRMASQAERRWVREALREHCAENFPDLRAP
ncbi:MAG TPA: hypothetical protein VMG62_01055 [Solirubrobacteraceae bacterium]|nr:hypothetical protein [Solirubrobacteraceae bacterium]